VAVLGEMLELGDQAVALHEGVGRAAAAAGIDRLVAVGGDAARALADAAVAGGMSPDHVLMVADSGVAASLVAALVQPADLILVKGSHGIRTDQIVDRLRAEHA
jgi:UDP-N-acetylmuramoyl-tripeptide--D-alanyl-D-alanine ligase